MGQTLAHVSTRQAIGKQRCTGRSEIEEPLFYTVYRGYHEVMKRELLHNVSPPLKQRVSWLRSVNSWISRKATVPHKSPRSPCVAREDSSEFEKPVTHYSRDQRAIEQRSLPLNR